MRYFFTIFILFFTFTSSAYGDLIDRGEGLIYNDVLDVTWLQDANYSVTSGYDADGMMDWYQANAWAEQLVFAGYSDWRLPYSVSQYNVNPDSNNDGELGYLFYDELGGQYLSSVLDSSDPDVSLFNNIQPGFYWFRDTPPLWSSEIGALFGMGVDGTYEATPKTSDYVYAWAVHDGDIGTPVPEPATMLLLGTGLIGLAGVYGKRFRLK